MEPREDERPAPATGGEGIHAGPESKDKSGADPGLQMIAATLQNWRGYVKRLASQTLLRRVDLEDILQEVYLNVADGYASAGFSGWIPERWLKQVIRHTVSNMHRHESLRAPWRSLDDPETGAFIECLLIHGRLNEDNPPAPSAELQEQAERALEAVCRLPPRRAVVFLSIRVFERPAADLAEDLGMKIKRVYKELYAAQKTLRTSLTRMQAEEKRREEKSITPPCKSLHPAGDRPMTGTVAPPRAFRFHERGAAVEDILMG